MSSLVVTLLTVIGIALVGLMLYQGLSRSVDILSVRNMYLMSFIVYQIISPAIALYTEKFALFKVSSPEYAGKVLLGYVIVYLFVFLLSYHFLAITPRIAKKIVPPSREMSDAFLLGFGLVLIGSAIPLRLFGWAIPVVGGATAQIAMSLAAVASAVAGWVWGNRRFNPAVLAVIAVIVVASLALASTGVFGRRPLLSVLIGFAWGAYHRRFKYMNPVSLFMNMLPLFLIVVIAVSAFTAMRKNRDVATQGSVSETVGSMRNARVNDGAKDIVSGQATGSATLWCIENYPYRVEPKFLNSFKTMVYYYIPRAMWPAKPLPLGNHLASLARIKGVNQDKITLPPGVIGYASAEGGWIAIFLYAIFYGQFLRFFDDLIRLNPTNAIYILPIGCATGQILGLARGCIAIFANLFVISFLVTLVLMYVAFKLFGRKVQPDYWYPWPQPR